MNITKILALAVIALGVKAQIDKTCNAAQDCASGTWCDVAVKKCKAVLELTASCSSTAQCASTLLCSNGRCQKRTANGGACDSTDQCYSGSWCNTNTKRCAATQQAGKACIANGQCAQGLTCTNKKCAPASANMFAQVGGQCGAAKQCGFGLFCNNGTCAALGSFSGSCALTNQCMNFLFCNTNQRCQLYRELGESCSASVPCNPRLTCGSSSTCVAKPLTTQPTDLAYVVRGYIAAFANAYERCGALTGAAKAACLNPLMKTCSSFNADLGACYYRGTNPVVNDQTLLAAYNAVFNKPITVGKTSAMVYGKVDCKSGWSWMYVWINQWYYIGLQCA